MNKIRLRLGEPYVFKCPWGKKLIVTSVMWGSGAVRCKCNDEIIHFDYISDKTLKENQEKYKELIKEYEENIDLSNVM